MKSHDVNYRLYGDDMQFVEIELDPQETVVAEAGAMIFMEGDIAMDTTLGDGSSSAGGFMGKLMSAGKRAITGESLMMTTFTNKGNAVQHVSFGSPYPGKIIPVDLAQYGERILCQKDAFLCAAKGTKLSVAFQKKLGAGFFGGEGFILQSLEGDGKAFIHAGGTIVKRELGDGEALMVDTGCVVALTSDVNYDIQVAGNVKTALFGGEGIFLAHLSGPGTVWLQSLPFSRLADRVIANANFSND